MTMTQTTFEDFIAQVGLTHEVRRADSNPHAAADEWSRDASHWTVTLHVGDRSLDVPYSMGSAHTGEPVLQDVLDALASDSAGIENAPTFEDWCDEYGYDTDSRRAERTYNAVREQRDAMHSLLGDEAFQTFLWDVERL